MWISEMACWIYRRFIYMGHTRLDFLKTNELLIILRFRSLFLWKIFQSSSLCLATTTPEQLAFALRWFMLPLTYIGVPVAEIVLTLLLSLRFISLVFDEVREGMVVPFLILILSKILYEDLILPNICLLLCFIRKNSHYSCW